MNFSQRGILFIQNENEKQLCEPHLMPFLVFEKNHYLLDILEIIVDIFLNVTIFDFIKKCTFQTCRK